MRYSSGDYEWMNRLVWGWYGMVGWDSRTVAVFVKVEELVVPLCDDTKGVFEEGRDNQETANGG